MKTFEVEDKDKDYYKVLMFERGKFVTLCLIWKPDRWHKGFKVITKGLEFDFATLEDAIIKAKELLRGDEFQDAVDKINRSTAIKIKAAKHTLDVRASEFRAFLFGQIIELKGRA